MQEIIEGNARVLVSKESKISKKLEVFYNPVMKNNRDLTILFFKALDKKNMQVADILAGSGVRSIRLLKELPVDTIKNLLINDLNSQAVKLIKKNLSKNNIQDSKVIVVNKEANVLLLESKGFDYIDVDPFGTPNPFLDSSINRLARNGVLAVTATDTSSLAGTYPKACMRKYWAKPLRNELKHEIGLRILIRKVQLVGAQYEKALIPIFSYSKDHYYRVFFKCQKGKSHVDKILSKHDYYEDSGPLWNGILNDVQLLDSMIKKCTDEITRRFLQLLQSEEKVGTIGFFDIHKIAKKHKLPIPNFEILTGQLIKKGYNVSRTQFSEYGIKTNISKKELLKLF
ncbi:methyltransferase [Candidatus Woesearchaeota archaeon]|nr:methyltransferase [Candidatus Woesearchaeota archaeon]